MCDDLPQRAWSIFNNDYSVHIAGGTEIDNCHVAIIDTKTNSELARYAGHWNSKSHPMHFDASKHKGEKVFIKTVDRSEKFWGNIAFGGICTK